MSYDIIKSIKVKDNKVYVNCASNNVYPRYYEESLWTRATEILQNEGKEALDLYIMKAYESGNFQKGKNKYVRALRVLRHMTEYATFDWRRGLENKDDVRNSEEFNNLLRKALVTQLPREKYYVSKPYGDRTVYLYRITKHFAKWTIEKSKAKVFRYKEEAESLKGCFQNSNDWVTERVK